MAGCKEVVSSQFIVSKNILGCDAITPQGKFVSKYWSSYPCQGRGFNMDRASDSGCNTVSPRLQVVPGASLWGWRHGPLSKSRSYGRNWTVGMEPERRERDGQDLFRDPTASEPWTSTVVEIQADSVPSRMVGGNLGDNKGWELVTSSTKRRALVLPQGL